jgi:hypothetical protein
MKKGRFSKKEQQFIEQNCEAMPLDEIASELDRDPDSVESFIKNKLRRGISRQKQKELNAAYDLKNRPYWSDLKAQFSSQELEMFLFHWGRIISQFRDDVLPTEELQVIDAIKLELLMNRALKEQQANMLGIENFEGLIEDEKNKAPGDRDIDYIFNLERQVAVQRAAQESIARDYKDLQTKKNAMLKELKGTREQRIKRLEDSKETFASWIQALALRPEMRDGLGTEMEKMRLAMDKERVKLTEYHKYEDGVVDQPFLTPDSVLEDNV